MVKTHNSRKRFISAALGALALGAMAPASAEVNMFDGEWHFSVTPYAWLPNVNGSTSFAGPIGVARNVSADIDSNTVLSHLEFAAMISGEVRKGEWSVFTDYIYLSLGGQKSTVKEINGPFGRLSTTVDLGSSTSVKGDVWTLAGGYSVWHGKDGHLDVIAGTRYLSLDTTLDWNVDGAAGILPGRQGSVTLGRSVWDGIIGVKGEIRLGEDGKWFMPYYADVGTGSHNTTWQALLGGGYRYGWGNLMLAWRSLSYKFSDGSQNADVRFSGPAIGATFVF
jgi:hypothetical protein